MSTNKFYEAEIKDTILEKPHLFLNEEDRSTVIFEKGIMFSSTIADCMIFAEKGGIIGIEIKTEYDNIRRLKKQLRNYETVCDYVYVLCHDNHVEDIEELLNKSGFGHVGILSYSIFREEVILGRYKEPVKSPKKSVQMAYQMLWKSEINNLLGSFKKQVKTLEQKGYAVEVAKSRSGGLHGLVVESNASKRLRKTDMIKMIVSRLGEDSANTLLCNIFISGKMHVDKELKYHYFKQKGD